MTLAAMSKSLLRLLESVVDRAKIKSFLVASRLVEQRVESSPRSGVCERIEPAVLGDLPGRMHESAPRRARQCAADAHTAHAELGQLP